MVSNGIFLFKGYTYEKGGENKTFTDRNNGATINYTTKEKYRLKCDEYEDNNYNECYIDIYKDSNPEMFNKFSSIKDDLKPYSKLNTTWSILISKNAHILVDIQQVVK